jgi:hypothetical protein
MLFAGYPGAVSLYRHVRKFLEGLEPVEVVITKTQVSFRAQRGLRFYWMWRPLEGVKGVPDEGRSPLPSFASPLWRPSASGMS